MTADLRTQLAEAERLLWPFGTPIRLSHESREQVERIAMALAAVRAEGAAEALRDALVQLNKALPRQHSVTCSCRITEQMNVVLLDQIASLSPTVTPTTEENPK